MTPLDKLPPPGPVRTCVGCRGRAAKSELLRVTVQLGTDGRPAVVPDLGGAAAGRGAHLHPTERCFQLAEKKRAFVRALRHDAGSAGALDLGQLAEHLARHQI
ncbi:MAG: YlxR family protein [Propionibacteriales bacterium]|nr:YlxR family protein [Propionibacteriales bacterium]